MNTTTESTGTPVAEDVLAQARAAVKEYYSSCFWFWNPEAAITSADDVRSVIEHLRGYGDKQAWRAAQDLSRGL